MKKLFSLSLTVLVLSQTKCFSQQAEFDKAAPYTLAMDSLYDMFFNEKTLSVAGKTQKDIINEFLADMNQEHYYLDIAKSKEPKCKPSLDYSYSYNYVNLAEFYEHLEDYKTAATYIDKAVTLRPTRNNLAKSEIKQYLKVDDESIDFGFSYQLYYATRIYYQLKNYKKVLDFVSLMDPSLSSVSYFNAFAIYHEGARAAKIEEKNDLHMEYRTKSLQYFQRMKADDKAKNENLIPEIIKFMEGISSLSDPDLYAKGADAIVEYKKYGDANKLYSNYAKSKGSPALNVGWSYAESAMKEPDKTDARNAVAIIEKYTSGFSEYDWERLQKVYEFIGDMARVQEIKNSIAEKRRRAEEERKQQAQREEQERKRREKENRTRDARGNFSVAVATNPFMYIWSDYPISLDIRIRRIVNEFRVNFSNTRDGGDKYRFGQSRANGSAKNFPYHYSGMEYSYTLKILSKKMETKSVGRRKQLAGSYFGMQPRYSNYNFADQPYTFQDPVLGNKTFNTITASATRYDFCLLGGFLGDNLGGFFHIDYYFGVGIGYKQLNISSTDPNFNYSSYTFDDNGDRSFDPARWNKIYVPVRFGFRIGINLL